MLTIQISWTATTDHDVMALWPVAGDDEHAGGRVSDVPEVAFDYESGDKHVLTSLMTTRSVCRQRSHFFF